MNATASLLGLLERHYIKPSAPLPGGVFLPEVGWNGGPNSSRCDALYVGFTSASGRLLVGHELKVSRSDWLNELNKPGKADAWADQCHQWWLVVNDPDIVSDGELPAGWGLMSPGKSRTRMKVHIAATTKTEHTPSWTAVRSIMARQDTLRAQAITKGLADAQQKARANIEDQIEKRVALRAGPDAELLHKRTNDLQDALGAEIDWDGQLPGYYGIGLAELGEIAAAARALGGIRQAARHLAQGYDNPVKRTRRALDQLDEKLGELGAVNEAANA